MKIKIYKKNLIKWIYHNKNTHNVFINQNKQIYIISANILFQIDNRIKLKIFFNQILRKIFNKIININFILQMIETILVCLLINYNKY
jgi:hypothetical protein